MTSNKFYKNLIHNIIISTEVDSDSSVSMVFVMFSTSETLFSNFSTFLFQKTYKNY